MLDSDSPTSRAIRKILAFPSAEINDSPEWPPRTVYKLNSVRKQSLGNRLQAIDGSSREEEDMNLNCKSKSVMSGFFLAFAAMTTFIPSHASAAKRVDKCEDVFDTLATYDAENGFELKSINMQRVSAFADAIKHNISTGEGLFFNQEALLEDQILTAATGQNMFMEGGPGGSKTAGISWLFPDIFTKQTHEMMTDLNIIGGQTEAGAREGKEDINLESGMVNKEFALLDEVNNANPQLFATLMSLLNPDERMVYVNGQKVKSTLRSVFLTGNATRYEILRSFLERGMQSGPAVLNRCLFKANVANWLPEHMQEKLDNVKKRIRLLKSVQKHGDLKSVALATAELEKLRAKKMDFGPVEVIANSIIETTPELEAATRGFAEKFRLKIAEEIKKSSEDNRLDPIGSPQILTPSAEWTTRFTSELLNIIRYSAALDLLRTGQTEMLNKPPFEKVTLGPLSLWRVYSVTTTIGAGMTRLNPTTGKVEFNMVHQHDGSWAPIDQATELAAAKNPRDEAQINDMYREQKIFMDLLDDIWKPLRTHATNIAAKMPARLRDKVRPEFEDTIAQLLRR